MSPEAIIHTPLNEEGKIQLTNSQELSRITHNSWEGWLSCANMGFVDPAKPINFLVVLCPMYAPGTLGGSTLVANPQSISESRVAGKWQAYTRIIAGISEHVSASGNHVGLKAVFANRGVLLGHKPTEMDSETLLSHEKLYQLMTQQFGNEHNIDTSFDTYNSYDGSCKLDIFVDPTAPIPFFPIDNGLEATPASVIEAINYYLEGKDIDKIAKVKNNKQNKRRIKKIAETCGGYSAAFWLTTGYLAFDYNISNITGDNPIYLQAERIEPLLGVVSMTSELKYFPRIDVKS